MQPDFVPNIQIVEATKTTNNVKYVLQSIENKLPSPTRVATIVLNLDFPQKHSSPVQMILCLVTFLIYTVMYK